MVYLVVRNLILVPKFIYLIFSLFFCERWERLAGFWYIERKSPLKSILIIKIIDFGVNEFSLLRGVSPRCFCFLLLLDEVNLREKIFEFWLILDFRVVFLGCFRSWINLSRCLKYFGWKWVETSFLTKKMEASLFWRPVVA